MPEMEWTNRRRHLDELVDLRREVRETLIASARALQWFSRRHRNGGVPRNTWSRPGFLPASPTPSLGLAFSLWHALNALERSLRCMESDEAKNACKDLGEEIRHLNKALVDDVTPAVQERTRPQFWWRLVSDEVFGTLSSMAAARVLRAEVFPERFQATPSYVAGHVLFAEFKFGKALAETRGVGVTLERAPSLSQIVQAVAAVLAFCAHLKERVDVFEGIQHELDRLAKVQTQLKNCKVADEEASRIERALVQTACPRLFELFRRAATLMVATRDWFSGVCENLGRHPAIAVQKDTDEPVTFESLRKALLYEWKTVPGGASLPNQQDAAYTDARQFAETVSTAIASVVSCLADLLKTPVLDPSKSISLRSALTRFATLHEGTGADRIAKLQEVTRLWSEFNADSGATAQEARIQLIERAFSDLQGLYPLELPRAATDPPGIADPLRSAAQALKNAWEARVARGDFEKQLEEAMRLHNEAQESFRLAQPSIRDSARFQITWDLACATTNDAIGALLGRLNVDTGGEPTDVSWSALTEHESIGALLRTWRDYAAAYEFPPGIADAHAAKLDRSAGGNQSWIETRHATYESIKQLIAAARRLDDTTTFETLSRMFDDSIRTIKQTQSTIERQLRDQTRWCSVMGRDLLLESVTESSPYADPLDIVSALWLAERIGDRWSDDRITHAKQQVERLQRPDGGFVSRRPPIRYRSFTYFAPSVSTASVLGSYLTSSPRDATLKHQEVRLRLWEKVFVRVTRFLLEQRNGTCRGIGLMGWHSDRNPQEGRIDCRVTTLAVRALCDFEVALTNLVNSYALEGLRVESPWLLPSLEWRRQIPTDIFDPSPSPWRDACPREPRLAAVARQATHVRFVTTSYFSPSEVMAPPRFEEFCQLFFGPPGTGKTYSQQLLASELRWPLVTITMRDFLRDGDQVVGRTTSEIFDRLSYLSRCCILFDEFDQMVYDRAQQGPTMFALLTPMMLPLLADLHDRAARQHLTVSFTTNQIDVIDQAARRAGRIDLKVPVVYPSRAGRLLLALMKGESRDAKALANFLAQTALCAYSDVSKEAQSSRATGVRPKAVRPESYLAIPPKEARKDISSEQSPQMRGSRDVDLRAEYFRLVESVHPDLADDSAYYADPKGGVNAKGIWNESDPGNADQWLQLRDSLLAQFEATSTAPIRPVDSLASSRKRSRGRTP